MKSSSARISAMLKTLARVATSRIVKLSCATHSIAPRNSSLRKSRASLLVLEPRIVFDGAAGVDVAHTVVDAEHVVSEPTPSPVQIRAADPVRDAGKKEAAFVDTSVADYQKLIDGVDPGIEIYLIDSAQNGLAQIANWAETHSGYDAIHILSHGSQAQVHLGTEILTRDDLHASTVQFQLDTIGNALNGDGDLLLYGCDVAAGDDGQEFIEDLAAATGADVAASIDATGAANEGGDWTLEIQTGVVDSRVLESRDYQGLLATVTITGTDADYSATSFTKTAGGRTLTFSNASNVLGMDTTYGAGTPGLYAYEGTVNGSDIKLTIAIESGYTFDISSFKVGAQSGQVEITLTYANGSTETFSQTGLSNSWQTVSSFNSVSTTIGDIKKIELTSTNFSLFQDFDVTDVKAIAAAPTVTDAKISITSTGSGTGGAYKIGDTVTASWNNTAAGDNNSGITGVTMNFSGFGGGATVAATESSGTWTASYTIVSGAIDGTNKNVSVSATNTGGTSTTADTTNLTLDNVAPTVTDAKISISGASGTGGAYKIGDTVTATWNNTAGGDNNSDTISSVTVNISAFGGGAAVAASNSAGTWTATYTIVSGAIDGSNRNVSVTATDNAGNTTTTADTTNATLDNVAPTVTDAKISISGASGTGGTYKIGDTVTATWNNTAAGDNNSDTISSVTVDFSQFGGGAAVAATNSSGTWTATYTIVAGAINGTTNRNVSVTATDNAGNTTTTADTTNATVDNVAPSITFSGIAFSADTGSSSSDFITSTASQTITATLSGALAGSDIVYGSLDNGSTWNDITNKVSGTTLTWNGVTLTASNTLKLKVTDAAGNDGTAASQAYTLDTSAPSAPSTPDMTSGTDSGTSSSDDITSDTTPTFSGTAESGSTVTLYDTDGSTVLGTATATGGNWSITSSALSAGSHTVTAKATDAAGNTSSASSGLTVTIDATAPTSVASSTTTIATQNATSTSTIATLSATDSQAITYSFAVGNGVNDADNGSFTISGTSLKVGGVSLSAGTYKIYVAATDAAGNVANQAFTITIVDAPSISSIVRTGGASATVNTSTTSIQYTVTFSESVTGVDTSDFALTSTGTADGSIASISGSGTTYTVTVNALSGDGTLRLDLDSTGTGIKNGSNVDIASGYTSGSTYTLDHTAPSAPSTPDMTAGTDSGTSNSDNITNDDTPTFTGTAESSSTVTLYDTDGTTVLGTATATGGSWSITSSTLSAGSHTVTAKATDAAGNVSSASSGLTANIDTSAPTVSSVSVPSNGSYKAGQTLSFTVNTSEAVTVDTSGGTPRLELTVGGSTVYASYASGSGSSALVFSYTVQAGDTDSDGIAVSTLQSNGGTLKDTAGNTMTLTLNSVGATTNVLVDTTAPTVSSVSVPSNGTYYSNQNLDFTVNFSEAVTVNTTGGTPRIALTLDTGGTVYANYLSGSGTSALVFRYTVADGVLDSNGVSVGTLGANGGTLKDTAGNDATVTLNSVGSTAAVNVDGTQPRVLDVTATTANGTYNAGDTVAITATFSKVVTVDTSGGTPTLALDSGGSATYASGSGTTTLVFTYTVDAGENSSDLDFSATGSLALNGATIKETTGSNQDAVLTLASPGAAGSLGANKAIVIDTTAPTITFSSVAFSADTGASTSDFITKTAAQTITATLSGAPAGTDIVYGSLDNGANWTDITSKVAGTALTWNGVTLTASNTLKLKVTDAVGNDGAVASQAYTLDTSAPSAPSTPDMTSGTDTGTSSTDNLTNDNTPTFSGTAESGSTVTLYDTDGATVLGTATATGGNWSINASALAGGSHTVTAKATDTAGNISSASSGLSVSIDVTATTVASVSVPANASYNAGDTLTFTVNTSEAATVDTSGGTPRLALDIGGSTVYASYASGSGSSALVFTYTVQAGENDANGITVNALQANGGTLKDAAGNDMTLTLNSVGATTNVLVDSTAPTITFSDVAFSADTGTSSSDFITNTTSQTITATLSAAPAGSDVIYGSLDNGATWTDITSNVAGTTLTWNGVTLTGSDTLKLKVTDSAGNDGTITSQAYLLDTTVGTLATSLSADSGSSNTDSITSNGTVNVSGLEAGATWQYSTNGGTTWATGSGTSFTPSSDGAKSVVVRQTDVAGNTSSHSTALTFTLDSSTPIAPATPTLSTSSDSGASTSDRITNATTPTFTGTAETGTVVTLYDTDGTTSLGTTTADATSGAWSIAVTTLTSGIHTVTAEATDAAGNVSAASTGLEIVVDPVVPTITGATTGQSVNDNATLNPFAAMIVADAGMPTSTQTLTIALDLPAAGVLSNLGGGTFDTATGVYSFTGTAAEATAAVNALVFTPTANRVSPGETETVTFTVLTTDAAGNAASNANTSVVVTSANDTPTIEADAVTNQSVTEGQPFDYTVAADIFADMDAGDTLTYSATLANGTALPSWLSFDSATRTFSGTPTGRDVGAIDIKVIATDASGASTHVNYQLTIVAAPPPPLPAQPILVPAEPVNPTPTPIATPTRTITPTTPAPSPIEVLDIAPRPITPTPVFVLTRSDGFPVVVTPRLSEASNNTSTSAVLTLGQGIADHRIVSGSEPIRIQVPNDAFVHTRVDAQITLRADMVDGSPLPNWLQFDPAKGEFTGVPPEGITGVLSIKVTARDQDGNQVQTIFHIRVSERQSQLITGKPALLALFQRDGVMGWKAERDHLVRHAQQLAAKENSSGRHHGSIAKQSI